MDYKQQYTQKLVSAAQAATVVKSGDWVDYGWTTSTPVEVASQSPPGRAGRGIGD